MNIVGDASLSRRPPIMKCSEVETFSFNLLSRRTGQCSSPRAEHRLKRSFPQQRQHQPQIELTTRPGEGNFPCLQRLPNERLSAVIAGHEHSQTSNLAVALCPAKNGAQAEGGRVLCRKGDWSAGYIVTGRALGPYAGYSRRTSAALVSAQSSRRFALVSTPPLM